MAKTTYENIELYCVRADFGKYTQQFIKGNYVGIGWLPQHDLFDIKSRDELYPLYKATYPNDKSNVVIGQQVGQIARFLLEIKAGAYVITPAQNTEYIYYGIIDENAYYFSNNSDGLINGPQLVDILAEHWNEIPIEFKEKLNLKVGLVPN